MLPAVGGPKPISRTRIWANYVVQSAITSAFVICQRVWDGSKTEWRVGAPDYNEPGKRKGKTKDADKSRKEELEGEKIQTIADKKVCPLFVAVINATPKGEKRKYIENR